MKKGYSYSKKNKTSFVPPMEYWDKLKTYSYKGKVVKVKQKRQGFDFMVVIRVAAIIVFVITAYILFKNIKEYVTDVRYSEAQNRSISISAETIETEDVRKTPTYPKYKGVEINVQNFEYPKVTDSETLKQFSLAYPDFVFWFYIDDSYISYPVVQAADNDFYLRRNMDGETNASGTLFLDFRNDAKNMGGHTIIYGHSMQNGTMFGTLKKYEKKDYWESHQYIYTYTANEVTRWKVFSAYETDTTDYYIDTYFTSQIEYYTYIDDMRAKSIYDTGVTLSGSSDVLTLSTCHIYTKINGRFVVHAVKDGTTPLN